MENNYCVYMHKCIANNKTYIGITNQKPENRWKNGTGYDQKHQSAMYNAIKKYGWDNFEHIIWAENLSKEEAEAWEIRLIALFKTNVSKWHDEAIGYNMTDGGDGTCGYIHTEEAKKKMKENHYDCSGENHPMYGKHPSAETRKKMSESAKKRCTDEWKIIASERAKNQAVSEETRQKLSKANRGVNNPKAKPVSQFDKDGIFIKTFDYIQLAADELHISSSSIAHCCRGDYKTAGGYIWRYVESEAV